MRLGLVRSIKDIYLLFGGTTIVLTENQGKEHYIHAGRECGEDQDEISFQARRADVNGEGPARAETHQGSTQQFLG